MFALKAVDSDSRNISFRLDRQSRFNNFSPAWYSLCRRHGLKALEPDRLLGRAASEIFPSSGEDLRRLGEGRDDPHTNSKSTFWQAWSLWPSGDGFLLTLRAPLMERWSHRLGDPLFGSEPLGEQLRPLNDAAELLLQTHPELERRRELDLWLSRRPLARTLVAVDDLSLGGSVLYPALPSVHGEPGLQLLSKLMRTLLHDMNNPLSAVRMMAEVAGRGSRTFSDPSKLLTDMIRHLDLATSTMRRLRGLVHVQSRARSLDALGIFSDAVSLLHSELDRRDLAVDLSKMTAPEPELEQPGEAVLLLALAAILITLRRAGEGDRALLLSDLDDDVWRVEGRLESSGSPRPWFADPDLGLDLLADLLKPLGGRLVPLPHDSDSPMWRLELPL